MASVMSSTSGARRRLIRNVRPSPSIPPVPTLLDYSHFVEILDQESEGVATSYVTQQIVPSAENEIIEDSRFRYYPTKFASEQAIAYEFQRRTLFGEDQYLNECPYCCCDLQEVFSHERGLTCVFGRVFVKQCPECGWWEHSDEYEFTDDGCYVAREIRRRSMLREFSVSDTEAPVDALRLHLNKHPNSLRYVSPKQMELLVHDVWKDFMDCEALSIGGPNDGGIDVVLINGARRYAVQVKHRSRDAPEPVSTVREFVGALIVSRHVHGIIVSSAPRFTQPASLTAIHAIANSSIETIELVDGRRFLDVCSATNHQVVRAWQRFTDDLSIPPALPTKPHVFPVRR